MQQTNIILQVAGKAILMNTEGQIVVLRESAAHLTNTKAGHYHLPGGRIEPGETFFDGLKREVLEETGLSVELGKPVFVGEWRPVILGVPHQIVGVFLAGKVTGGVARLSDEHDDLLWIHPRKWADYDIVMPDRDAIAAFVATL